MIQLAEALGLWLLFSFLFAAFFELCALAAWLRTFRAGLPHFARLFGDSFLTAWAFAEIWAISAKVWACRLGGLLRAIEGWARLRLQGVVHRRVECRGSCLLLLTP